MKSLYIIYIDDSGQIDENNPANSSYIFSAIAVPYQKWNEAFERIKDWRKHLRDVHGIPVTYEMHAHKFISGRGSMGSLQQISRHKRAQIFHTSFKVTEWLTGLGVRSFNVCHKGPQDRAFERLLNRINRTMDSWDSSAMLICDEGKEHQYTRMVRRMKVFNHIPSNQGAWASTGSSTKNIPLDRIIEDPIFKNSAASYFVQQADLMAYGLLRREFPTPKMRRYGAHKSFNVLDKSVVLECNKKDPKGVIR